MPMKPLKVPPMKRVNDYIIMFCIGPVHNNGTLARFLPTGMGLLLSCFYCVNLYNFLVYAFLYYKPSSIIHFWTIEIFNTISFYLPCPVLQGLAVIGNPVDAKPVKEAIQGVLSWLDTLNPGRIVMGAHNGRKFDFWILMYTLHNIAMVRVFCDKVFAFVNSLSVFKKKLPGRTSNSQESIVKDVLGDTYNAHNALDDTMALSRVIQAANVSRNELMAESFTPRAAHN